jgi:hypothetical protein
MRIQILDNKTYQTINETFKPNTILDVPNDEAKRLVNLGFAKILEEKTQPILILPKPISTLPRKVKPYDKF